MGVLVRTAQHREAEKKAHNIPVTLFHPVSPVKFSCGVKNLTYHKPVTKVIAINEVYIYLLTATELTPGGSSTVHVYTQTIRRTTQLIWEDCGPCPVFASYTLAFALQ